MDLQAELGLTFLMVTHDQDEAMAMADRISVMERGRIAQVGAPEEIYETPTSRYVAEFVGDINVFEGVVSRVEGEIVSLDSAAGPLVLDDPDPNLAAGQTASLAIRPEKISIQAEKPATGINRAAGEIWDIGYLGDFTMVQVKLDGDAGQLVKVAMPNRSRQTNRPIAWEDRVWITWDVADGILLRG